MVMIPRVTSAIDAPSVTPMPTMNRPKLDSHTTDCSSQARRVPKKKVRITAPKRCMAWGPPPLARRSSMPASRSSMKPNSCALFSRSSLVAGTPRERRRNSTRNCRAVKPVRARPIQGFSSHSSTRMPPSSSMPPRTRTENCEKKLLRAVTSPSIRSIISPAVWAVWKRMSSRRQCRINSARMVLVARQPTSAPA